MKSVILLFAAIVGVLSFTDNNKDITGTWILQDKEMHCEKTVVRMSRGEGIWQGKLDIPAQEVYDKELYSVKVDGDSVTIEVFEGGSVIKAKMVNDSTISGNLQLDSSVDQVLMKKI